MNLTFHEPYKVTVPPGTAGPWKVDRFEVDEQACSLSNLRACICRSQFGRGILSPGTYTRLTHEKYGVVMSDTPDEVHDHLYFIKRSYGRVLITGLGLGMVAANCLKNPKVTSVTVIELDPDVIKLVEPHLRTLVPSGKRLEIIQADAYTWEPARMLERWHCCWHDIWPEISDLNLPEMSRLHRRYRQWAVKQGAWARGVCAAIAEKRIKDWDF